MLNINFFKRYYNLGKMCTAFKINDIFSSTVTEKMAFKTLYKRINDGELLNVVNYYLENYS